MEVDRIAQLRHHSRKLVRELGMLSLSQSREQRSSQHWHTLIEISGQKGITTSALTNLLLLSKSTLSRVVNALIKEGLVTSRSGVDKREKYLYLTPEGAAELKYIDEYSEIKIKSAFKFLTKVEQDHIISAINLYAQALEKGRLFREQVKIMTLPTTRFIRKKIVNMIGNMQRKEYKLDISDDINISILKAEETYYYNNSYNFWYAIDNEGMIIGCIGLAKLDNKYAEIKKFFIVEKYRGKGVSHKLMQTLIKAAAKHEFSFLVLGTIDKFKAAQQFYLKYGFKIIKENDLPNKFIKCKVDNIFMFGRLKQVFEISNKKKS